MFESERGEPRAVRERLAASGWDDVALAGVSDLPWDRLLSLLEPVVGRLSFGEELQLRSVLAGATLRQGLSNTAFAAQPAAFFKDSGWARRYGPDAETPIAPLLKWDAVQKGAPVARWPTRFQRSLEQLKDGDSREALERNERDKVVQQLGNALRLAGLWAPDQAEDGRSGPAIAHHRIAMGRRLGTLRQHVRNITKMTEFCLVSFGRSWFTKPRDFYDLVATHLAEPCGKHVPRALLNSVVFAEQAAEIREDLRLSKDQGIRNFLREVEASGGWKTGKVVKKA